MSKCLTRSLVLAASATAASIAFPAQTFALEDTLSDERIIASVGEHGPQADRCARTPEPQRAAFRILANGRVVLFGSDAVRRSCLGTTLASLRFPRTQRGSTSTVEVALAERGLVVTEIAPDPAINVRAAEASDRASTRIAERAMRALERNGRDVSGLYACYRRHGNAGAASVRLSWRVEQSALVDASVHAAPPDAHGALLARCMSVRTSFLIGRVRHARGVALVLDLTPP